jgi:hypothetical protein
MRCVTCGLPLSPVRKSCPRCGSAIIHHEEKRLTTTSGVVSSVMQDMFKPAGNGRVEETKNEYVVPNEAAMPSWQEIANVAKAPAKAQPSHESTYQHYQPAHSSPLSRALKMGKTPVFHISFVLKLLQKRSPRFNLMIATLCVLSGAMLLIAVFIVSLSLPSPAAEVVLQSGKQAPLVLVPVAADLTPSPSTTPTVQPTTSSTPSYAGQQYIDNAQMASAVNFGTAQPLQLTTQFYRNQKIYVTFALHPGRSGTACLLWYLNNQEFTTYIFAVDNVSISAYSYALSGIPGPGYVEIYWASSTTCADKVLAQRVSFTVI